MYQATDSKLGRSVAIKLLPEAFTNDAERAARFEREARVLASLNHSNIAAIYGIEESGDRKFLVMELAGGETLAERIKRGPIQVNESLGIAKQICEALEAAHEKGIIHRDLKPANVKVAQDGKVKVLDFGLAKAFETETSKGNLSQSPTLSMAATNAGMILGTAAYMSPEQAKGRAVDRRTDIFAFGCVLYEMLTGRAVFEGEDVQDILGAVLKSEPDWTRLPRETPPGIRKLLRRCLEKNVKNRRSDGGDVRIDIEDALAEPVAPIPASPPAQGARMAWIAFAAALLAALALTAVLLRPKPVAEVSSVRFIIPEPANARFPPGISEPFPIISPDGRRIAFRAQANGENQTVLWMRSLDTLNAEKLPGTEGGNLPFWSPDGHSVGFFTSDRKLKKIDVLGGPPLTLADAVTGEGGTWNREGTIVFGTATGGLMRVPAVGGTPTAIKPIMQASHRWPHFLPDGRHFLFLAGPPPWTAHIGSLDSDETKQLFRSDSKVIYSPPGYLLFIRGGVLMAQLFDAQRLELGGDPFPVAEDVRANQGLGRGAFSVSDTGVLVYRAGQVSDAQLELTWFDRAGKSLGTVLTPGDYRGIHLSPDSQQLAVHRHESTGGDVWIMNLLRGTAMRFTFDPAKHFASPLWSPDGTRVTFQRDGSSKDILQKPASGAGQEETVFQWPGSTAALLTGQSSVQSWSPNGQALLFNSSKQDTGLDLWVLPSTGDRKPLPYLEAPLDQTAGQFSPDGRWVAYASNESGRDEIYVRPFPSAAQGVWQISQNGGNQPRWRTDGRELFFITPDRKLMAVDMKIGGSALEFGLPHQLFESRINSTSGSYFSYDVSRDGQRFLITSLPAAQGAAPPAPLTVLLNWTAGLKNIQK